MVRYNREDSAGVRSNYWRQEFIQLASLAASGPRSVWSSETARE
ncbi:hypothetical protein [Sphingobium sp. 3R8]|nr:hypothetical protein [Sphingobium sp. 3R8]